MGVLAALIEARIDHLVSDGALQGAAGYGGAVVNVGFLQGWVLGEAAEEHPWAFFLPWALVGGLLSAL
jgi:hypothetical protein